MRFSWSGVVGMGSVVCTPSELIDDIYPNGCPPGYYHEMSFKLGLQ
jgi:hypothetical protein